MAAAVEAIQERRSQRARQALLSGDPSLPVTEVVLALAAQPTLGQDPLISETDATMPESGLGSVIQIPRMHYDSGLRMMKQANKAEAKIDAAETPLELNLLAEAQAPGVG